MINKNLCRIFSVLDGIMKNVKHLESEKDLSFWHYRLKNKRKDGLMEVGKRGIEWDRKWKAFSSFTPRDLISVIMGFMSFPSWRPHTTSHAPGHTLWAMYLIHWLRDERTLRVFLFLWQFLFSHSLHQPFAYFINTPGCCKNFWLLVFARNVYENL